MIFRTRCGLAFVLIVIATTARAQSNKSLTARELFYTPLAQGSTPAPQKPGRTTAQPKPKPPRTATPPAAPDTKSQPEQVAREKPPATPDPGPQVVQNVSAATESLPPLALRYSILKRDDSSFAEVDPESTFHSGDRIRVAVEGNDSGYLYIVQQGSSKAWEVLFPNQDTDHGNNRIEPNRSYTIPGGGASYRFDTQAGTERVFIVFSRRPEPDMEKLIYSLSSGGKKPAAAPSSDKSDPPKVLLASAKPIDDAFISKLRTQLTARDLVFEKVDESKPGPNNQREKAMYVATQDRTQDARIVVDLKLRHE